ncbi:hypothetical protein PLEOSDRAFT_1113067 [Pleurotus ostreatus PC15]|uniref:Uncharacterized protein n=1 Tax=Pleurotus ostreatus (strain PC15) TaxID=1137138 RepID=A0A067NQQ6_PLEO1|nr:hypothetical protein PLEOSDRAFT_1113067 [Pleurotus ostreatus PC15]
MFDAQYDRPQEDVRMSKPHKSHQHHASHRGTTTRYKEKFQAMRERYEHVNAKREAFGRELEIASEKERQLQAENDLLLDTLAIAMAPPQMEYRTSHSSSHADIQLPPRDVHSPAPEGLALPTNGLRDSHHVPRSNGVLNGSAPNGSSAGLIEVREPAELNSHEEKQERH